MSKDRDFFSKLKASISDTEQPKKFFPAINSAGYPFYSIILFYCSFTIFDIRFFWLDWFYIITVVCLLF